VGRRAVVACLVALAFGAEPATAQPNIVFILTDDQRVETMRVMPTTRAAFNVAFSQFVVTTPNCCPSRSTLLTGRYVRHTGVFNSTTGYEVFKALEPDSLGPWLQAQGYRTGFVGKYFNGYARDDPVPPGWDEFYGRLYGADRGNGTTAFTLREYRTLDGLNEVVAYPNADAPAPYATRVFGEKAAEFISRSLDPGSNPDGKPFALFLWTTAVNTGPPEETYADAELPTWKPPPSFLETDMSDKPREVRRSGDIVNDANYHAAVRASQLRQLLTLDDVIGGLLDLLDTAGVRANTVGIFTSDNGRFWGEHRLRGKVFAYEESLRVPFRMMIPGRSAQRISRQTANIDVAPTISSLAGDLSDHRFDGESLLRLLDDAAGPWRPFVVTEHFGRVRYDGVRGLRWTYVEWTNSGHRELYDRAADPFQLNNVAGERPRVVERLARRLDELLAAT
jgi:N-acetylglucosamine-6-sulfatase